MENFIYKAIIQNVEAVGIICDYYGKTTQELAKELKKRVIVKKGKMSINFTDVNTNQTIKF